MADEMSERTEEATPKRRSEARKKGTVAKSVDLTHSLALFILCLAGPFAFAKMGMAFLTGYQSTMSHLPTEMSTVSAWQIAWNFAGPGLVGLALILGIAMTVGVASNFAQVGFVLSAEPLTPNFAKLNPAPGLKRLVSAGAAVEGLKAILKSFLFGLLAYQVIAANWGHLLQLAWMPAGASVLFVSGLLKTIGVRISMAWLLMAIADYLYQRKRVDKQLRMTKDEVRREAKEQETSMEMKMAMAKRRRQLMRGRVRDAVKQANVIVTNPTHYAIALKYEVGKDHAPQVVAKGQDLMAAKIRELAAEFQVPIVPNPPLARALYRKCEIGDFVPREYFEAVAEVLAYVYRVIKRIR